MEGVLGLEQLKAWFSDSEESPFDPRTSAERGRDCLDGNRRA